MQPSARVEHVPEREQVRLIRAAAVMEDQQPVRLTVGLALEHAERRHDASTRTLARPPRGA